MWTLSNIPQEIRDLILGFALSDDTVGTSIAMNACHDGAAFVKERYPITNLSHLFRRDGLRAFTHANEPLTEVVCLSKKLYTPVCLPRVLASLNLPYSVKGQTTSHLNDVCGLCFTIRDHLFEPVRQTMHFGDLVWDHDGADVINTFYNVADLVSDIQEMLQGPNSSHGPVKIQIVYVMSTEYAAESLGDARVGELWRDLPITVGIDLDAIVPDLSKLDNDWALAKQTGGKDTADSFRTMSDLGYIPSETSQDDSEDWDMAKDRFYREVMLRGRNDIFDAWLADVRLYHSMLVRVMQHIWRSSVGDRKLNRELFSWDRFVKLHHDDDGIEPLLRDVGAMLDRVESGPSVDPVSATTT